MKTKGYTTVYLRKVSSTNFAISAFSWLCFNVLFSLYLFILVQPPTFTTTATYLSTFRRYDFFLIKRGMKISDKGCIYYSALVVSLKVIHLFIWEFREGGGKKEEN